MEFLGFNSIKVQLERNRPGIMVKVKMFQFHKGSIRTNSSCSACAFACCFNSIKVQLERSTGKRFSRTLHVSIP